MIRLATIEDIDAIVSLSEDFYREIRLDEIGYRFDITQIRKNYLRSIECGNPFVLLYFEASELCGIFAFSIRDEHYFFSNRKFGAEIVWHTAPNLGSIKRLKIMIKLLAAGEMLMKVKGATGFYCQLDARREFYHPGINNYLIKSGYTSITTTYYKEIL